MNHTIQLLNKLDDQHLRDWYAVQDAHHGWSRAVLQHQIATRLHERTGAAPSNFGSALERGGSELAQQLTKDPYALDFLAIDSDASERSRSGSRWLQESHEEPSPASATHTNTAIRAGTAPGHAYREARQFAPTANVPDL